MFWQKSSITTTSRKSRIIAIVIAGVSTISIAAVQGIIGNRADSFFLQLLTSIFHFKLGSNCLWIITCSALMLCVIEFFYFTHKMNRTQHLSQRSPTMKGGYATIFRMLVTVSSASSQEERIEKKQRIMTELLKDCVDVLDREHTRAMLFIPDYQEEMLGYAASWKIPAESISKVHFYIGEDEEKRQREGGIVGLAYQQGHAYVGHMIHHKNHDQWTCDIKGYVPIEDPVPYNTFVCLPLFSLDSKSGNRKKTIGILCFDSTTQGAFDSEAMQRVLEYLTEQVLFVLSLCEKMV